MYFAAPGTEVLARQLNVFSIECVLYRMCSLQSVLQHLALKFVDVNAQHTYRLSKKIKKIVDVNAHHTYRP